MTYSEIVHSVNKMARDNVTGSQDLFLPCPECAYHIIYGLCYIFDLFFTVAVSVVLGVPTVRREAQSYLLSTIANLIDSMDEKEQLETLIVVSISEVNNIQGVIS